MPEMKIGADYYPEHWPRERWDEDIALMRKAGFNITRLAEFSWVKMEPEEGRYDFAWLDEAIDLLGKNGISVLLCTPTPTMPKWLYDKYPEVVLQDKFGHPEPFGNRQSNCFSSKTYRQFSRTITRKMAERYKDNPYVIGWQIDNELRDPFCFCPHCENAFRDHLKEKYGTVEALNEAWGTNFWSQCYASFAETHLPRHQYSSPSLVLEHRRFHSNLLVSFAKEQVDILREVCPQHFITHNYMSFMPYVDYFKLGELMDIVSHDYYYNFADGLWEDRQKMCAWGAATLDLTRGTKRKNFIMMENSAGPGGWDFYGRNLRPGELRRMTFQNMAHGVDIQVWFRWRTSRFGTEQYFHGILGHDGVPGRRYDEAAQTAADLQTVWKELEDSHIQSDVAFVFDYSDYWAMIQQTNNSRFQYIDGMLAYYRALYRKGINVDFVNEAQALDGYKVVVLPHKYLLTAEYAAKLSAFVKNGGTLLTTCRSGVKNDDNVPHDMTLPGYLRELCGVRVEEYEAIPDAKPYRVVCEGESHEGKWLADWILPEGADVLASYAEEGIDFAAVTRNHAGKGTVYYVGTVPDDALSDRIFASVLQDAGLEGFSLPQGTEMTTRTKGGHVYRFVMNHSSTPQSFALDGFDLLTGRETGGSLTLEAGGVAVVKQPRQL